MILEMKNIVKTYGSVIANDDVSLYLNEGEVLAIVGENGAGKSTIMKILYGLEKADSGQIFVKGQKITDYDASKAMKLGIGMVQQHFMLFDSLSVAENIVYKHEKKKFIFYDKKKNEEEVEKLSKKYGLYVDPKAIVKDCPVGIQQRIEILKTLYQNADIIIFDEPSAVLTPVEVDELLVTIRNLANTGKSIILITHKLNEVMSVADRVVVMRSGKVVGSVLKKDTSEQQLSMMMIGRHTVDLELKQQKTGENCLKVENLTMYSNYGKKVLDDVNLHVDAGEIVGVAGVSGNGQSELIQCITGLKTDYTGKVFINGSDVSNKDVATIRSKGESHIPEDRYYWGSAREATLVDNFLMGQQDDEKYSKNGIIKQADATKKCEEMIEQYHIKANSSKQKIKELSGGNAQKLITAREIERDCKFTIACEPTRGIDIGATEFVHERLIQKREEMIGILLVSSELSEILKLSDRIYVIFNGQIVAEFKRGEVDSHKLGMLMLGGKLDA